MNMTRDYIAVHAGVLARIERGVGDLVEHSPTSFTCRIAGLALPDQLGDATTECDGTIYDDEKLVAYLEAQARMRAMVLLATVAMKRVMDDPECTLATDQGAVVLDEAAVLIGETKGTIDLYRTALRSGQDSAVSYLVTQIINGASHRLAVVKIDDEYFDIRDQSSFEDDPELMRVFEFLLPGIGPDDHALLTNLLCGRIEDVSASATRLLSKYVGTSLEEEAARVLDIVVDRSEAALSARSIGLVSMSGLPSADRLQEWASLIGQSA